jgi:xylulose-5-phosphate/fructose-6-phosphate phosphoketolase
MSHLDQSRLDLMHRYWSAANYLTIGQIYLQDNPLLREPLRPEHIKPRLLGHWGTSPGLSFIYVHLNRLIQDYDVNMIYLAGLRSSQMSTSKGPTARSTLAPFTKGELGYVLAHAFGADFDNPDLVVTAVVGDGEAETAPLEGAWKSIKFLNPVYRPQHRFY